MIRCAGFDFDGTLVDSNEIKRRVFFEIAEAYDPGGKVVQGILDAPAPGDRFAVTRAMAQQFCDSDDELDVLALASNLAVAYTERSQAEVIACDEIPGASQALEALHERGLPLYINTAVPREAVLPILRARKLDHHFAGVFGSESDKVENLRLIVEHARSQPEELVFVGDGEDDRRAAGALGCAFIGVALEGDGRFDQAPRTKIPDLRELERLVDALDRGHA